MIEVQQLVKSYGDKVAINQINFTVKPGEIFGLLGPNGAGKSTTINCISGLISADQGSVTINGHNIANHPRQAKQSLGLVPQDLALYEDLSAHENLIFWGSAYGLDSSTLAKRIQQVLIDVGLESRQREPVKQFSGGMKRRLNFACALLHQPKALLLDEPTVGVDPQSREHLMQAIITLKERGTAVIYTSHYMEEVEKLCDHLAIVDQGQVIASGTIDDLRMQMGERDLITLSGKFHNTAATDALLQLNAEVLACNHEEIRLLIADASKHLSPLLNIVNENYGQSSHVAIQQANLESLFIKLTGRALRDEV